MLPCFHLHRSRQGKPLSKVMTQSLHSLAKAGVLIWITHKLYHNLWCIVLQILDWVFHTKGKYKYRTFARQITLSALKKQCCEIQWIKLVGTSAVMFILARFLSLLILQSWLNHFFERIFTLSHVCFSILLSKPPICRAQSEPATGS